CRPAQARRRRLSLADAAADRGRTLVALARGGRNPVQGGGVGLDTGGRAAAAGLGRSAGAAAWLCPPGAARPLPAAARVGSGRLPLRAAGERACAASVRLDRHDARAHVQITRVLGKIGGWTSCTTVSSASSASTS